MTDYAKPDSLPFRAHYFQQRRKKRKAANALIQRYITSLSAAADMHYPLSEPVVIGAGEDFEIEIPIAGISDGYEGLVSSNDGLSFIRFLDMSQPKQIQVRIGSNYATAVDYTDALIRNGSEISLRFVRTNGDLFFAQGSDALVLIRSAMTGDFTIDAFGKYTTSYFTGEIYDVKIWTGGDRNTGTLVLDMPIDEDWKTSTDLHDAQGNVIGSAINVTENEADLYTLINDGTAWQSDTRTIQIAQ